MFNFVSKFKTLKNSCWFQNYFNKDDANVKRRN